MREIDFTNIALGMESSPSFVQQIQNGVLDRFGALLKALSNASNQVVKIYGCVMTVTGTGTIYNQTAGVVYYQGNLYSVDAFSGTHATQIPVYALNNIFDRQAWYGDAAKRDTFFTRKLKLQLGVAGSGIANYDQAVLFEDKLSEFLAVQTKINTALVPYAPINNPVFTGNPTAPTQALGNDSLRLATTAFVQAAISALVDSSPATLNTLKELADALGDDPNFATTVLSALGARVLKTGDVMTGPLEMQAGFRTKNSGKYMKVDVIPLGDWNMDADQFLVIDLGSLDTKKIKDYKVMILDDFGFGSTSLEAGEASTYLPCGKVNFGNIPYTNTASLDRKPSGFFDGISHDQTGFNRGFLTIWSEP